MTYICSILKLHILNCTLSKNSRILILIIIIMIIIIRSLTLILFIKIIFLHFLFYMGKAI